MSTKDAVRQAEARRFCGMRCERNFHRDLRDNLVNLDEANAFAAGGRCAYCVKPFPEEATAPSLQAVAHSKPLIRPAGFCGAGCARKAKKVLEEITPPERSALQADLDAAPKDQCAWCGKRTRRLETLDKFGDPLLERLTREEKSEAQHHAVTPSRQGPPPNVDTVPGRHYTKDEWRQVRAGWWAYALLGVLINFFTLGIFSTVLFTLWQSADEERTVGKRIGVAVGMSLVLFVPLAWIWAAGWSRDWYFLYEQARDEQSGDEDQDEEGESSGQEYDEIATLEAEVETLRRAKRAADLRAEIARLQAELGENEHPKTSA